MLKPPMRSSTLATFDDVNTMPETTSPGCGVVELIEYHRICGGSPGASIKTVGVGEGAGDAGTLGTGETVGDGVVVGAILEAAAGLPVESGAGCCAPTDPATHATANKKRANGFSSPAMTLSSVDANGAHAIVRRIALEQGRLVHDEVRAERGFELGCQIITGDEAHVAISGDKAVGEPA